MRKISRWRSKSALLTCLLLAGGGCRDKGPVVVDSSGSRCGNGVRESAELCDGSDLGGRICTSEGFGGGTLTCKTDCSLDAAGCFRCGDGKIGGAEVCDGTELGGKTCQTQGFDSGELGCTASCELDLSKCTIASCGNGKRDAAEPCEGLDLGGKTCQTQGFAGGTLSCNANCSLNLSACFKCGDNVINGLEQCDGAQLGGKTCKSLGFAGGTLGCKADCTFSTSACQSSPAPDAKLASDQPLKGDLSASKDAGNPLCLSCIKLRVGRPLIARGPYGDEIDTSFTVIPLGAGSWRGFSANSKTFAIDGAEPYAMGGARTQVLAPGNAGSYDECGRWLNYAHRVGSQVHGFIHAESSCNYAQSQTHKSMVYASSSNYGLGWTVHGQIITGLDSPTAGKITGEGDCSIVEGGDGHYYAYCLRASDWKTIVARCPTTNPMPGSWNKYHAGQWSQPGVGGQATSLGFVGHAAGRWTSTGQIINIAVDPWSGGLKLSLAPDKVTFAALPEPLLVLEQADWNRPAPTELMEYVSLISQTDGTNQVDGAFLMSHMYIQPGDGFSQRYLVFRDVYLSLSPTPASPQVGVALSRWYNASLKDRWSTTAPVPGNYASYQHEGIFGYLLTKAHPSLPTNKLEDCVGTWPGHPDHLLTNDGTCVSAGYTRLRTAGWVFTTSQPGTVPLYRCYSQAQQHHFASNAASCDGLGTMEWLLGYALAN